MFLAVRLTAAYERDTILEMYLNEVYFGQLAYGVEAAAQTYFGKPAGQLDLAESALLAGLIQAPSAYDPLVHLDAARARQQVVLGLMVKHGSSPRRTRPGGPGRAPPLRRRRAGQPSAARRTSWPMCVASWRSATAPRRSTAAAWWSPPRWTWTCSARPSRPFASSLAELDRRPERTASPTTTSTTPPWWRIDPATGQILAMVGSADYFDASIDGAVNVALALRQPGSAIKPVTYAAAFAHGLTPATVINDVPATFITREGQAYAPQNYDRQWHGPISLRQALATSSNMVAVRVLDHIGLPAMLETARDLGITTLSEPGPLRAGADAGRRRGDPAGADRGLCRLRQRGPTRCGRLPSWRCGTSTAGDAAGVGAARRPPAGVSAAGGLPDHRHPVGRRGAHARLRRRRPLRLNRPAAAKTGTTTDFRDNWTLGYTPHLAVGVWVGNADNEPMVRTSGVTGAAPIWHDFMEAALAGTPGSAFARPDGIVEARSLRELRPAGHRRLPAGPHEIFIGGTEPLADDDTYRRLTLDAATGLLWADGCAGPPSSRCSALSSRRRRNGRAARASPAPPAAFCDGRPPRSRRPRLGAPDLGRRPARGLLPRTGCRAGPLGAAAGGQQQIELAAWASPGSYRCPSRWTDGLRTFDGPPYRTLWPLCGGNPPCGGRLGCRRAAPLKAPRSPSASSARRPRSGGDRSHRRL